MDAVRQKPTPRLVRTGCAGLHGNNASERWSLD
jgi:hypothetical protein